MYLVRTRHRYVNFSYIVNFPTSFEISEVNSDLCDVALNYVEATCIIEPFSMQKRLKV